ncbi:MAG TPA: DUF899 domain-containing protein [Chthoniobacterales bacterium]|nr:DUF899 domain-containing protein [Chthoniobacterales bacterium]
MTKNEIPHPKIVSQDEWLAARKAHLEHEKELTKHRDQVNAERRRLPMVKLEKEYVFDGPSGKPNLKDLFESRRQFIVYHFMFDPEWDEGCPGCTGFVNALGNLSMLQERDTSFVLVSRAPLAKLERYKTRKGWDRPWVSSYGSDFNYDFHVTLDEAVAPVQYNFRDQAELEKRNEPYFRKGEQHGMSVFFRSEDDVFHTYSSFARGCEGVTNAYSLLDRTPYGRQEDFEDSPPGWPQKPTYG